MIEIINLEGELTGPARIAQRFAAERDRVESFNQLMRSTGMSHRTALWHGLLGGRRRRYV